VRSTRRQFLGAAAASTLALAGRAAARPRTPAPRHVVQIILAGGMDALLTVDPKDQAAVGTTIDVGYRADERVRGRERLYGPLMGALLRHEAELCLVHGVRVDTTAHPDGYRSLYRGRANVSPSSQLIGDACGQVLPGGAPIDHLVLGSTLSAQFVAPVAPRGYRSTAVCVNAAVTAALFDRAPEASDRADLFRRRPPWRSLYEARRAAAAAEAFPSRSDDALAYAQASRQAADLGELLAGVPDVPTLSNGQLGRGLKVALSAIERNRARYITAETDYFWLDTHTDNLHTQKVRLPGVLADIAAFVDALKARRNAFGPLIDQTTIVIGSEVGRFPRLNAAAGKDHWPENSWILLGRGIRGGATIGATDASYRGTGADYASGLQGANARPIFVEAIFATLLAALGRDPKASGYAPDLVLRAALAA
jgi:uncharacterized protein (DUF1501 family)